MRRRIAIITILSLCFISKGLTGQAVDKKKLLSDVRNYRIAHEHAIINEYFELLSIPNVSHDAENVRKNAMFIKNMMEKRGIRTQILETKGNPVVYGELNADPSAPTLMFYVHYDGQPVDPSRWTDSRPFKPVLRPGKLEAGAVTPAPMPLPPPGKPFNDEWRIYARSSSDDKAPVIALLTAVDALKEAGFPMKNNLKFILEGEEEAGSPNLAPFLEKHKGLLKCDVLYMCDGPTYYSGDPTFFYGVRGITSISITVYGPNTSLHSGHYGNWAPNPAMRLATLLASMKDESGKITVKGFYDTVVPLSDREIKALSAIPSYEEHLKKFFGFSAPEDHYNSLMEAILYPSLNVNGIESGWVGKQARTIIPSTATASIDIRLTKGNDPRDMVQKVIEHIKSRGYHVVSTDPGQETRARYPYIAKVERSEKGYRASRTSMDLPVSVGLINALTGYSERTPVSIPSLGGSLPIYVFENTLKVPIIGIPVVNYDNNQHQSNENLRIGHLWQAVETFAAVIMMETGI